MSRAERKDIANEEGVGSRLGLVVGAMAGKARLAGQTGLETLDSTRLAPNAPLNSPIRHAWHQRCGIEAENYPLVFTYHCVTYWKRSAGCTTLFKCTPCTRG